MYDVFFIRTKKRTDSDIRAVIDDIKYEIFTIRIYCSSPGMSKTFVFQNFLTSITDGSFCSVEMTNHSYEWDNKK